MTPIKMASKDRFSNDHLMAIKKCFIENQVFGLEEFIFLTWFLNYHLNFVR